MAGRLKPLEIERLVAPGKYADGDGLYLVVNGPSARNWSYRYWFEGKERWHGLGSSKLPGETTEMVWFCGRGRAMFFQATAMSYGKAAKVDVFQMLGNLSLDVCCWM